MKKFFKSSNRGTPRVITPDEIKKRRIYELEVAITIFKEEIRLAEEIAADRKMKIKVLEPELNDLTGKIKESHPSGKDFTDAYTDHFR